VKCGSQWELSADHIHPESKGGPTTIENLQALCRKCNSRKRDKVEMVGEPLVGD
jgi:5-methylcytosine-specific restriction endonuclease McrA